MSEVETMPVGGAEGPEAAPEVKIESLMDLPMEMRIQTLTTTILTTFQEHNIPTSEAITILLNTMGNILANIAVNPTNIMRDNEREFTTYLGRIKNILSDTLDAVKKSYREKRREYKAEVLKPTLESLQVKHPLSRNVGNVQETK